MIFSSFSRLHCFLFTLGLIGLDQATKLYANEALSFNDPVPLLPHLNATLLYNKGAAFSFLAQAGGWQHYLFLGLAIVISAFLSFDIIKRKTQGILAVASACIIAGALGNAIDRLIYGHVIDFIDFYINSWHWPAFNFADSYIFIGAFLMFAVELCSFRS